MAVAAKKITIVGCGPGGADYVTPAARQAAHEAEVLMGSRRLLELFGEAGGEKIVLGADTAATLETIAAARSSGRKVTVLVSGDPGLFSLARQVVRQLGREACDILPGITSVQVAFARVGLDWSDARVLSAHGRTPSVAPDELLGLDKIAILAGSRAALRWSAETADRLRTTHTIFLCENLTLEDERIRLMEPEELEQAEAASLAIVLILRRNCL